MSVYQQRLEEISRTPQAWVVTGAAGFIGSNLLERLLLSGQRVVGVDNLASGFQRNLDEVQHSVGTDCWERFQFIEGDIRDPQVCERALAGADHVIHLVARTSVPLSIKAPEETHSVNVSGFLGILMAARSHGVKRVVYASSSAVYGDDPHSPKVEERLGNSISPYATSKRMNELYADVFSRCYGLSTVGLRYFNIFGPRQDPNGAYAAVIPCWISAMFRGDEVSINGDGKTSRDFCFVQDVVQANILAATADMGEERGTTVFNIGTGKETTLNDLFVTLRDIVQREKGGAGIHEAIHKDFRPGDVRHSCADISRARRGLGFVPDCGLREGLASLVAWSVARELAGTARG